MSSAKSHPVIFLDRDGVINENSEHYIRSTEEFIFLPGTLEAIRRIALEEVFIFVVTNQSGVARGYFSKEILESIHGKMQEEIVRNMGRIDEIFSCIHHPDECCDCRKPSTGMLNDALARYAIDSERMFLVGDSHSDIIAGNKVGCYTIMIRGPRYDLETELLRKESQNPDAIVTDLNKAVDIILYQLDCVD